jgi:hypothetical protein
VGVGDEGQCGGVRVGCAVCVGGCKRVGSGEGEDGWRGDGGEGRKRGCGGGGRAGKEVE